MKLYHGTWAGNIDTILKEGIKPRGRRKGNWKQAPSNPRSVYLSDVYAPYFAITAADKKKPFQAAVIEVDASCLVLHSDEDIMTHHPELKKLTLADRISASRNFQGKVSLDSMGTCAHEGIIPPWAITRIATFTIEGKEFVFAIDPTITPLNYMLCKNKYARLTAWLFGDVECGPSIEELEVLREREGTAFYARFHDGIMPSTRMGVSVKVINPEEKAA